MDRRRFLTTGTTTAAGLSFLGLHRYLLANQDTPRTIDPYGPLIPDPNKLLDLPKGFNYRIISRKGELMNDGYSVPGQPDGMAAFAGQDGRVILIRNHELQVDWPQWGPFSGKARIKEPGAHYRENAYDSGDGITPPHLGGTTTIVYNPESGKVEKQFLSLAGTDRNCAGGAMPWGSWITCEEPADLTSPRARKHGYCFEVKATEDGKLQRAVPLKALGRFRHEAVALDPRTGILYLTEDINDGLLYRFIPEKKQDFTRGKLQALALQNHHAADLRNYRSSNKNLSEGDVSPVTWIDLKDVDAPNNDLRFRGHNAGAAVFARGEGIFYTDGHIYICCTDGGPTRQGQILKLTPSVDEKSSDQLELFLQPQQNDLLTNGDNLCSSPWGDLIICEDLIAEHKNKGPHLRGVTPQGKIYTIARNAKNATEFAGSCFSPDGNTLFVNMQSLGYTLAITGPWRTA